MKTSIPHPVNQVDSPIILIIEDNTIALFMLENLITQTGFRFISAIDGESALNLMKKYDFDLIITDIGLPGITGIEFTRILREDEQKHQKRPIPIVGLTAHVEQKIKTECVQAGMNEALTKPLTRAILERLHSTYLTPPLA